jgi:hypothetical protein
MTILYKVLRVFYGPIKLLLKTRLSEVITLKNVFRTLCKMGLKANYVNNRLFFIIM